MPPPPPPPPNDSYTQLIAALHPPPPTIPEIEILPSHFPPLIHHDPPSIGIPKSLLAPLHLRARAILFSHLSSPSPSSHPSALQATFIILLFDPNHLTAANFRKAHLQSLADNNTPTGTGGNDYKGGDQDARRTLAEAVGLELRVCESLVTSALSKHAKSSTLWAQRLWVVRGFFETLVRGHANEDIDQRAGAGARCGMGDFWDRELGIVTRAGERHPSNYYAWQYARQLFSLIQAEFSGLVGRGQWDGEMSRDRLALVHKWCLMHPRDISGWAFLVFLLEQLRTGRRNEGAKRRGVEDEVRICVSETKDFAGKYKWEGASVDWFLKAMRRTEIYD